MSQTSINRAFQKPSVEMMVARLRALTQSFITIFYPFHTRRNDGCPFKGIDTVIFNLFQSIPFCRNDGCPFKGIDTYLLPGKSRYYQMVEMMVARLRALTLLILDYNVYFLPRRNDGCPFKGIDTFRNQSVQQSI